MEIRLLDQKAKILFNMVKLEDVVLKVLLWELQYKTNG